ncbi:MAG: hypothetical protein AAF640_10095, partial [Pseudomonadota bacterium]
MTSGRTAGAALLKANAQACGQEKTLRLISSYLMHFPDHCAFLIDLIHKNSTQSRIDWPRIAIDICSV